MQKEFNLKVLYFRPDTKYYHRSAKHLLNQVLSDDLEQSNATLIAIASSVGNCSTPVNDLLEKTAIGILKDSYHTIPLQLELIMHRQAFEQLIRENRIPLSNGDPTEARSALTDTLFLKGVEENPHNSLQILGERHRIPSKTEQRNIGFAFAQITAESKEKFAKLICVTDHEGNAIIGQQGKYTLDPAKYIAITESYMKGIGVLSIREKIIFDEMKKLKAMIPESFLLEHCSETDVSMLIAFPSQEQSLRKALAKAPDNMIHTIAEKFLEDYRRSIERINQLLEQQESNLQALASTPNDRARNQRLGRGQSNSFERNKKPKLQS